MPTRKTKGDTDEPTVIAERLHSAAIHLLRRLRREDDASGLSAPRLSALSVIVFAGPITLGALATAEQVRPPTMTRLVQALEQDGLITRGTVEGDARSVVISATPRGTRLLHEGRTRRVRRLATDLRGLKAAELHILARAMDVLDRVTRAEPRHP